MNVDFRVCVYHLDWRRFGRHAVRAMNAPTRDGRIERHLGPLVDGAFLYVAVQDRALRAYGGQFMEAGPAVW